MHKLIRNLRESQEHIEDISHFIKKPGSQLGSNPGGIFHNPANDEMHYVKLYKNDQQARSEVAASKIYNLVGAHTVEPRLIKFNGKVGVATKWQDLQHLGPKGYHSSGETYDAQDPNELAKHFHAAILTKNWDTVGLEHDNLKKDAFGNLTTVDTGGSFRFRAMGGSKPYGDDIGEKASLVNGTNPQSADAFERLTPQHLKNHSELRNLNHENVSRIFKEVGVNDPEEHTRNLLSRRDKLLETLK